MPFDSRIGALNGRRNSSLGNGVSRLDQRGGWKFVLHFKGELDERSNAPQEGANNPPRRARPVNKPCGRGGICADYADPDLRSPERQILQRRVFQDRRNRIGISAAQSLNERHLHVESQRKAKIMANHLAAGTTGKISGGGNVGREKSESAYASSGSQKDYVKNCRRSFWSRSLFLSAGSSLIADRFAVNGNIGPARITSGCCGLFQEFSYSSKVRSLYQCSASLPLFASLRSPSCRA